MKLKNQNLKLLHKGKVRDIYRVPNGNWLIVTTDRLSAYDHVLPTEIPGRGIVLTQMSNFWMKQVADLVPNHLIDTVSPHICYGSNPEERDWLQGRCVEVKRMVPLKVEAIARGFLCGSAWTQFNETGMVNGIDLPPLMQKSERLPEPIYTPSTKEKHDVNITYEETISRGLLTGGKAPVIRDLTLELYKRGALRAKERGLICADTKFEFGTDPKDPDKIYLIDEVLTPDSSRFWLATDYKPGTNPPSFDKQIVRDWLDSVGWDRQEPAPALPEDIVAYVSERYWDAFQKICGEF